MNNRAARARRALSIQEKLHEVEEWKLADLQRQLAELVSLQEALVTALNDADALQDLFLDVRARRLRTIAEEIGKARREEGEQAARVLEQGIRAHLAANLVVRAGQEEARTAERHDLSALIDAYIQQ